MAQFDYRNLTDDLRSRQNPDSIQLSAQLLKEMSDVSYSDVLYYVRMAMNGVDPNYTARSKEAGENVKNHLTRGGIGSAHFEYQGSVMTNTHIKGHSDIDLLVISSRVYWNDSLTLKEILSNYSRQQNYTQNQINKIKSEDQVGAYAGNGLDDLRDLRLDSERIMQSTYGICDASKPKCIRIKNTSINREVDVVIANWYDDVISVVNDKGRNRGIQVYDKSLHVRGKVDFPFLSIDRINARSSETEGRLKKMIRFLKNLKARTEADIKLSSFDFNAICYDIPTAKYRSLPYYDLVLVLFLHLYDLVNDQNKANNLVSVDGREYIFRGNTEKLESTRRLMYAVNGIYNDLKSSGIV